jgi:hypothetical protein
VVTYCEDCGKPCQQIFVHLRRAKKRHVGGAEYSHSARTSGFSLMNSGKVSDFRSKTSEGASAADATAAAPSSPRARFWKLFIVV